MNTITHRHSHSFLLNLVIIFKASFFVVSCTNFSKIPQDTIVIGIENEIKSLDIRFANDANSVHLARFLFQSLVEIGEDLSVQPDLATEFHTQDNKTFVFKIPTQRKFHDGIPLSNQDVLFSFEQARTNPKIKSAFEDVESFETPNSTDFVIKLKKARASFVSSELPNIKIFPKHLGLSPVQITQPVGSGPFLFVKKSYRDIVLKPFNNYFDGTHFIYKTAPRFNTLILRALEDPTTRFLSLVGGDIDILFNALSYRKVKELETQPDLQVYRGPGTQFQYLGLNLRNPKFKDIRVRRALNISVNRKDIISNKLKDYAIPATGPLPFSNTFYDSDLSPFEYNLELAKTLLKSAGAENLEINLKTSSDRDIVSIAQVIASQWSQIGVKTRILPSEFASFFSDVQKSNFEIFSLRWTAVTEPDVLRKIFHSREFPPGRNRVFYENKAVDALLEQGSVEGEFTKRQEIYKKVQKYIVSDLPYIPLWYPDNIVVAKRSLKNFKIHLTGNWLNIINAYKSEDNKNEL